VVSAYHKLPPMKVRSPPLDTKENCKEFSISSIVVPLRRCELAAKESHRALTPTVLPILGKDPTNSNNGCVSGNHEGERKVRQGKVRRAGDSGLNCIESSLLGWAPYESSRRAK